MNAAAIYKKLKDRKPSILGHEKLPKYAVLLPLVTIENETHVLFEVRAMSLRRQPGEICFPGGRMDKSDVDERQCAIRETTEELGIAEAEIEDIIPLDILHSPNGNLVYPFAGEISIFEQIKPNTSEVGEIFTVPLSFLLETKPEIHRVHLVVQPEEGFPYDLISGGENYQWQRRNVEQYFYQYNGKVIWGLTARILSHFIELLRSK
ncbi:NUDIX hydrolase [Bacillus benzoevorans]|uniref:8-oxo-dGTP pyrophosphatase MutT (NUDIX family) n=1 Tax=Bacillus benzoevorans TaxID=1456 RepID=A0A7X0HNT4_9BACI|nr:CoA pyrophosphatase [Bacillus benzoevorans]MBB6444217.1 8-oxo-dGTP pyrophosphatase MutT (NUDIX family) [Bacillus benzoevorans]